MKIDPRDRDGKGDFPDSLPTEPPDDSLIDATLRKAATRTVLFDYLQMILVGFWNTVRGLLVVEGSTTKPGDKK